jgi:tetratricopeptide (TPR) repeat protein
MLTEAIELWRSAPKPDGPELAYAYSSLGLTELNTGHYKAGEADFRQAVNFANASLGEDHPETAGHVTNLALALMVQGEYSRAEPLLRRARFVIESRLGKDTDALVNVLGELTSVELSLGRYRLAEECGEKAMAILQSHVPAGSPEIALTQINLARVYLSEHKTGEVEKFLPAAVDTERRIFKDGRTLADGIRILATLRVQQHAWNEAETLYREALDLYERKLGADHPDIAGVLREYADVLKHQGAPKSKVRDVEARARSISNGSRAQG